MANDTHTVASGASIYAGRPRPLATSAAAAALMGDSLTTHLLGYNLSPVFWINGLAANGAHRVIANAGISGNTVGQMVSRIGNAYTNATPGLAGLGALDTIYVRAGTNDARSLSTVAGIQAGYTSLLNSCKALASRVIVLSVPPIGAADSGDTATKNLRTQEYNTWLQSFCLANSGFVWCDDSAVLRNPDGSQIASYFVDGVHLGGNAVQACGINAASILSATLAGYSSPISTDAADTYPAQPQWVPNHVNAGTGGGVSTGFTGQMPTGWGIGANGGGITGTAAIVAADAGDTNTVPWVRVTPTQVTRTGAGESIRITAGLSGRSVTTADPARLDVVMQLRFNAFDTSRFSAIRLWVQGNTGDKLTEDVDLKMGNAGPLTRTLTLRHAMPRPTATAQTSQTLFFDVPIGSNFTGSMGSFDFRCLTIRG